MLITENLIDGNASSLREEPREWQAAVRDAGAPRLGPSLLGRLPGLMSVTGFCQRSFAEVEKSSILSLLHFFFFESRRAVDFYQMLFFRLRRSCVFH